MTQISFPGLGIGPFTVDPIAFSVFGVSITWYGLLITTGMVLAFFYCMMRAKQEGVKSDDIIDLAIVTIILAILGARLYYVIFEFDSFLATGGTPLQNFGSTLANIVNIRSGGLAIYGGIIGGMIAAAIISKAKKSRLPILFDIMAGGVMIGQIIGRWGNFMNAEAYGYETTLPWRMGIERISGGGAFISPIIEVHPTFLYESLWNLIGFIVLCILYKNKKFRGEIYAFYFVWYGTGRAIIEGLRSDSLWLFGEGTIRVSQALSMGLVLVGAVILVFGFIKVYKGIDLWAIIGSKLKLKKKH